MPNRKREIRKVRRRYPIGAEVITENQTHFRIWAPKARKLDVVIEQGPDSGRTFRSLTPEPAGYFSGAINAEVGSRYRFRVNNGEMLYPDPASRLQAEGQPAPACMADRRHSKRTHSQRPAITRN